MSKNKRQKRFRHFCAITTIMISVAVIGATLGHTSARAEEIKYYAGAGIYQSAGCMGCHKWHGMGGTGYAGTPINFRSTPLTAEQIRQVVSCGRPGTGMPYFRKTAYKDDFDCYDMTREELGDDLMPPRGKTWLVPRQVRQVTNFIVEHFQDRDNEILKSDCQIFFGDSKMCTQIDLIPGGGGGDGH